MSASRAETPPGSISDVNTIQLAVAEYLVDNKVHPTSGEIGVMPPQLADRLPAGFPFAWGP